MKKLFEDYFSELQADMVSITLEYVDKKADYIYIYCSYERNIFVFDVFYKIKGIPVHSHKLNHIENIYDVSIGRQKMLSKIGLNDLKEIKKLCQEFDREMPTEMKLIYDVKKNSLSAKYSYDLKHSNSETLTAYDIFNQWFDEVAKENGQRV